MHEIRNSDHGKRFHVILFRYFLFEEKVTKENFRNHSLRDDTATRMLEFQCV
jgi:hypothetical protein